jgi:hypothetical protein
MGGANLILLILLILTYPNLSHLSQWSKFPDGVHTARLTCWILRLKFRPAESTDFADSAGRYINACTNRFIRSPPLPAALAPFAGLAEAGCSAAAGGSGAIAPSAAAAGSAPENWTQRRMWKKAAELCGERRSMILGWGRLHAQGTLRTTS